MLRLTTDDEEDEYTHTECIKSRMEKDNVDESRICASLKEQDVFQDGGATLKNIINKDVIISRDSRIFAWCRTSWKSTSTNESVCGQMSV